MDIFEASRLSRHRKIVGEMTDTRRGRLYEVTSTDSKKESHWALRIYETDNVIQTHGVSPLLIRQAQALQLQHPNIVKFYDMDLIVGCQNTLNIQCYRTQLLLLTELASGDLEHWMTKFGSALTENQLVKIIHDLVQGLTYLHHNQYVHKRVSKRNVLMVEKGAQVTAKLGDFHDLSIFSKTDQYEPLPLSDEDVSFLAPEILMGYETYLPASDMWSLGILVYEMVFGQTPFWREPPRPGWFHPKTSAPAHMISLICKRLGTPSREYRLTYTHTEKSEYEPHEAQAFKEGVFPEAKVWRKKTLKHVIDLIDGCLRMDPEKRITALQALKHPLFQEYNFPVSKGTTQHWGKALPLRRGSVEWDLRKELIQTIGKDVASGVLLYHPMLMALSLFDRIYPQLCSETPSMLYCACYLIAVKLMVELPRPVPDLLRQMNGLVCGDIEKQRIPILFLERTVLSHLHFRFYVNDIVRFSEHETDLLSRLEKRRFDCQIKRYSPK